MYTNKITRKNMDVKTKVYKKSFFILRAEGVDPYLQFLYSLQFPSGHIHWITVGNLDTASRYWKFLEMSLFLLTLKMFKTLRVEIYMCH